METITQISDFISVQFYTYVIPIVIAYVVAKVRKELINNKKLAKQVSVIKAAMNDTYENYVADIKRSGDKLTKADAKEAMDRTLAKISELSLDSLKEDIVDKYGVSDIKARVEEQLRNMFK